MKSWLHYNGTEIYSTLSKRKFVIAERFIRTLKSKKLQAYDCGTRKCVHEIVDTCITYTTVSYSNKNEAYECSATYSEYVIERNEKNSKFKIVDHVRISRYKNIFAKRYTPI